MTYNGTNITFFLQESEKLKIGLLPKDITNILLIIIIILLRLHKQMEEK